MSRRPSSEHGASKSPSTWRYHLSVDDVFESLFRDIGPEIEQPADDLFTFLTFLHASSDCNVELYVFEQGKVEGIQRSLAEVPDHLHKEFLSRPWLRVGPHAKCYEEPPFEQTLDQQETTLKGVYQQIDRFAGHQSRSRWLRLHYFSECYEMAPFLLSQGVDTLLLTDRESVSYRLGEDARLDLERTGMILRDDLALRRSFCRLEALAAEGWSDARIEVAFRERLMLHGYVALFTHEVDLKREDVRDTLVRCVNTLKQLGATPE